jgi:hypothetical protein
MGAPGKRDRSSDSRLSGKHPRGAILIYTGASRSGIKNSKLAILLSQIYQMSLKANCICREVVAVELA